MKPNYRSSYLVNYFKCPKAYKLSLDHPLETTDVMRDGLLFEGYVFDTFKEDNEKELIGRRHTKTIDKLKLKAYYVKKIFLKGDPFQKLKYDSKEYTITGEADYVGTINFNGDLRCIADLKFTGNLKIWDDKLSELKKEDFIQAFLYPFLWFQEKKEMLPFVYVVVENTFDNPLVKMIKFNPTQQDFNYILDVVEKVHADDLYIPYTGYGTCVNGKWGRCDFLEFCQEGRKFISETVELDLSFLN